MTAAHWRARLTREVEAFTTACLDELRRVHVLSEHRARPDPEGLGRRIAELRKQSNGVLKTLDAMPVVNARPEHTHL